MNRLAVGIALSLLLSRSALADTWQACREHPDPKCLIDEALATLETVPNPEYRAFALVSVVKAEARTGDIEAALRTAETIKYSNPRSLAVAAIALAQAKQGNLEGALATVNNNPVNTTNPWELVQRTCNVVAEIAILRAKAGDWSGANETFSEALTAVRTIKVDAIRSQGLACVARTQALAGDHSAAIVTFRESLAVVVADPPSRAETLSEIASEQAKAGDIESSLTTANGIDVPEFHARAMLAIAVQQAQVGNHSGASATFNQARALVRTIGVSNQRAWVEMSVALAQAEAGDSEGAAVTANEIEDPSARSTALANLALERVKASADAGDVGSALTIATGIEDPSTRDAAFNAIAKSQAEAGHIKDALDTADRIERVDWRGGTLADIAAASVNR
jgi:tetratricopeptide (TPR) repeat protein